jgi:HK97 family phage prohead protease
MNQRQAIADLNRELGKFSLQPPADLARATSIKRAASAVAELRGVLAEIKSPLPVSARASGKNQISGYGAIFGTLDADNEIVDRGAFTAALQQSRRTGKMPLMLWQHQQDQVIGVWDSIVEDSKGLLCKGHLLPSVQKGAEALALIAAKAIGDLSIGFRTVRATRINGVRHIQQVSLFEVSLVSYASNSEACLMESN